MGCVGSRCVHEWACACVHCECSAWELPPREDPRDGAGAPPQRPYIPFEGRSTSQDAYVPKVLEEGPTFGSRTQTGQGAPAERPYIPFEGRSTAQDSYTPKYVADGPTFGSRTQAGQEGPVARPYVPFQGESETRSAYPYVAVAAAGVAVGV